MVQLQKKYNYGGSEPVEFNKKVNFSQSIRIELNEIEIGDDLTKPRDELKIDSSRTVDYDQAYSEVKYSDHVYLKHMRKA